MKNRSIAILFAASLGITNLSLFAQPLDLVFANYSNQRNRICLNDGMSPPTYTCADVSTDAFDTIGVDIAELDGNPGADIAFANRNQRNRICLNSGVGTFTCSDVNTQSNNSLDVAVGDFDGVNGIDFAIANFTSTENKVCLNNGSGSFTCSNVSTDGNDTRSVAAANLDGTNGLDLVFSNIAQPNRVCLNNGLGVFTCSNVSSAINNSVEVAIGDINEDGPLDLVFGNSFQKNTFCLNNGSGVFTCSDVSLDTGRTLGSDLGDFDSLNGPDLAFGNFGERNRVCLNNGTRPTPGFTCSDLSAIAGRTESIGVGDVDNTDGPEVIVANSVERNRNCLNNGVGVLTCGDVSTTTFNSAEVAMAPRGALVLPVELASFEAEIDRDKTGTKRIQLKWTTLSEHNNAGFEVQHSMLESFVRDGLWSTISFVEGRGTTDEMQDYDYEFSPTSPGMHFFRLMQIDFDGTFEYSPEIEVLFEIEDEFWLSEVYPNPFYSSATLQFTVSVDQWVQIDLMDTIGRSVNRLFEGSISANSRNVLEIDGSSLSPGIYFCVIRGSTFNGTKQLHLIH